MKTAGEQLSRGKRRTAPLEREAIEQRGDAAEGLRAQLDRYQSLVPAIAGEQRIVGTPKPTEGHRRGRILVIDDEALIIRGMVRILSKEHDVIPLVAATDGLALCMAGDKFDLILCDLMMPDMTGMELHRRLSETHPDQADRMVFVTGGAFTDEARQFLAATLKEHLEKPFDPRHLRAIVQRYLR